MCFPSLRLTSRMMSSPERRDAPPREYRPPPPPPSSSTSSSSLRRCCGGVTVSRQTSCYWQHCLLIPTMWKRQNVINIFIYINISWSVFSWMENIHLLEFSVSLSMYNALLFKYLICNENELFWILLLILYLWHILFPLCISVHLY